MFWQRRMPEPSDQFQFRRLHFDENMVGLRSLNPGVDAYAYPLRRETRMELKGYVQGERVEPVVADYEDRLRKVEGGESPIQSVRMENITAVAGAGAQATVKEFNFILDLAPRPLKP
jgi:hypothetical protein